ncbi:MAG: flavin-dependent dehydrogenase [Psychromonas sp.]|jgi:flavin-dependent dehydrogenase|uniref:NAD(P)/FAD-dependent oxidoreductase n=1 Tax=Psychromonas sp. TaxID=1884585 RepID=UPI0039E64E56
MKKQITQVVIIGAGPSGAVAAALLDQHNIKVIVIEKMLFPRFSIGESLLPACMEVIEQANMLDAVKKGNFQLKNGAAFHHDGRYTEFDFNDKFTPGIGETYQVQRAGFDKILADQAQFQGVDIYYQHQVIDLNLENQPLLTVLDEDQQPYQISADFVLDASGFARVLPKLLDLEVPSTLPARKAIFTHIEDNISSTAFDRDKILISVHPDDPEVWYWLIPFSNGSCSLGVVAKADFLENYPQDNIQALKLLVNEEANLKEILANALYPHPSGEIIGYSANVKQLCSDKFALLGNAGEFLDPIFSSGVTIALKSAQFASETLVKQFNGEKVDWQKDYQERLMVGVNTFRCYVEGWYTGELQRVILHPNPDPKIKQMICAILAGYAWDINNPFVTQPYRRLKAVAEFCK